MKKKLVIGIIALCIGAVGGYFLHPILQKHIQSKQPAKTEKLIPTVQLAPKGPFFYDNSQALFDLPLDALHDQKSFLQWQQTFKQEYVNLVNTIPMQPYKAAKLATPVVFENQSQDNTYTLYSIIFTTY